MTSRLTRDSTVVASPEQTSSRVGEEVVVLGLEEGVYYGLDAVGARVWELIREPRAVADICETIVREYDVDDDRCARDVLDLLAALAERRLIEIRE